MKRALFVLGLTLAAAGCHSTLTGCMPDAGDTCKCTSADTVRDCFDKRGNPGIEYCTGGRWTNCAVFGDGGNSSTD